MMKRLSGFIAGLALGVCVPVAAQEIQVRCTPQVLPRCGNVLEMHFQTQGHIPNRCKIS